MKKIIIYLVLSPIFLAITLKLSYGQIGDKEIDVIIMYLAFILGMVGYSIPIFKKEIRNVR